MTDFVSLFPPGTIYAVFTDIDLSCADIDTVCCGGHFLTPQIMDRFVDVLGQTELNSSRTSDFKNVDIFRILENFIRETLRPWSAGLTRAQLYRFVFVLEKYAALRYEAHGRLKDHAKSEHMKRRREFLIQLHEKNWITQMKDKLSSMSGPSS
jgi:hypothetical protein